MTMDQQAARNDPNVDQSEHERDVAEQAGDAGADRDERPTSGEDLAADRTPDGGGENADVVGDDQSPPGQNSDRLPQ
ncbi:MAG TPA: hypothetical protein VLA76_04970 [Candidatus Angelobacter sp.]|nr:hypothetical protein [Candidatus Angelobacter sp.]